MSDARLDRISIGVRATPTEAPNGASNAPTAILGLPFHCLMLQWGHQDGLHFGAPSLEKSKIGPRIWEIKLMEGRN